MYGPAGPGFGLRLTLTLLDNTTLLLNEEVLSSLNDEFFGFVSDSAFTSIRIWAGSDDAYSSSEHYYLDNVVYSSVPEPETLVLFGISLLGMSLMRRIDKL